MSRIAVIGAGLSGLSAVHWLTKLLPQTSSLVVLEAGSHPGGWLSSFTASNGTLIEHGPRTVRATGSPHMLQLVESARLSEDVLFLDKNHSGSRQRLIYFNNIMHSLPSSLKSMCSYSSLFESRMISVAPGLLRYLLFNSSSTADCSVKEFCSDYFGEVITNRLIDPMFRGIYAGNLNHLSAQCTIIPMIKRAISKSRPVVCDLQRKAIQENWSIWTLRHGFGSLVERLSCNLNIHFNSFVHSINRSLGNSFIVHYNKNQQLVCDKIVIATPSYQYADILSQLFPVESKEMKDLTPYVSVAVVTVVMSASQFDKLHLSGFGHLLPSNGNSGITDSYLGVVYDSCLFPEQDGPNTRRVTCMLGGSWGLPANSHTELENIALSGLRNQLPLLIEDPLSVHVTVNQSCIPQYPVGYLTKSSQWQFATSQQGIYLIGASINGVSVIDCAKSGFDVANAIVRNISNT